MKKSDFKRDEMEHFINDIREEFGDDITEYFKEEVDKLPADGDVQLAFILDKWAEERRKETGYNVLDHGFETMGRE